MRQLYDEGSKTFSYLIWDKETEEAIIIDPVASEATRDAMLCTNLHLLYAINTHVHEDHINGANALKKKIPGLKSVISKASGAEADEYLDDGDEIHFGNRFVTAISTPGHTSHCMSFLLDDGKAILTGDTLPLNGRGLILPNSGGSAWQLGDSIFNKLFQELSNECLVLPGHDFGLNKSQIDKEKNFMYSRCRNMEEFVEILHETDVKLPEDMNTPIACNMKDGAKPFNVRSLRTKSKNTRWGIFG